jgi:hypothetical protein
MEPPRFSETAIVGAMKPVTTAPLAIALSQEALSFRRSSGRFT